MSTSHTKKNQFSSLSRRQVMDQGAVFLQKYISVKKRHFYRAVFLRHIYIHPFSKTLQLEKYIYIYIYLLFSYLFFCFRVVKTKDVYMYIYFSSCNVFENGCIYIYIYKRINKK